MSLPKTYATNGRATGLPIDGNLDYSGLASDDPVGEFPPWIVRVRMERLSWLGELYNGDLSRLYNSDDGKTILPNVQVNTFRLVPNTNAELLLMDPPDYGDSILNTNMAASLYDILIAQNVHGAAPVLSIDDTTNPLKVFDPAWWVPSETGWWYVEPELDHWGRYTTCLITAWTSAYMTVNRYAFGETYLSYIGELLEEVSSDPMPENPLRVIPRLPRRRGQYGYQWGTSILEDIASPTAEINCRYSDISYALDRQSRPTMTYRIADSDREDINPDVDETTPFGDAVDELAEALSEYDEHDHLALPNAIQDAKAITWDPQADTAVLMVQQMQEVIESAASIPGLFSGLMVEGAASGVALKRLMLRLYASTLQTHKATEAAVAELLGLSGVTPVPWPNPLEAMEDAAAEPEDDEGMLQ